MKNSIISLVIRGLHLGFIVHESTTSLVNNRENVGTIQSFQFPAGQKLLSVVNTVYNVIF